MGRRMTSWLYSKMAHAVRVRAISLGAPGATDDSVRFDGLERMSTAFTGFPALLGGGQPGGVHHCRSVASWRPGLHRCDCGLIVHAIREAGSMNLSCY